MSKTKKTITLRGCKCTGLVTARIAQRWPAALDHVAARLDDARDELTLARWRALCRESIDKAAFMLAAWSTAGGVFSGQWSFSEETLEAVLRLCGEDKGSLDDQTAASAAVAGMTWGLLLRPKAILPAEIEAALRAELARGAA